MPIAALAWALNRPELARRWLTAVRRAGTPTQGLYLTIIYRELRNQVGLLNDNPLDHETLRSIYAQATEWLRSLHPPSPDIAAA